MKKSVLLMAAATAIALSSCSSEDTKDIAKGSNITFRSTVGLNSRGTEVNTQNLNNIWVSAWAGDAEVFAGEEFKKKAGTTEFNSVNGPWFWEKDKDYTFMAFATGKDNKANLNPTIRKETIILADYTPSTTLADQLDLLTAQGTGTKVANETTGAKLDFNHILSQIQIKVKNTNENRKYIIKGVRISNVNGTGSYTFTPANVGNEHVWNATTPNQYVLDQGVEITLNDQNKDVNDLLVGDNSAMLIPQGITAWDGIVPAGPGATFQNVNGAYISLLINVQKKHNGNWEQVYPKADAVNETKFAWTAVAIPVGTWTNGNKYIYTLDLSKGAGKVDPVDPGKDWDQKKDPKPGEDILGGEIFFKVDVKAWIDQAIGVEM